MNKIIRIFFFFRRVYPVYESIPSIYIGMLYFFDRILVHVGLRLFQLQVFVENFQIEDGY